MNEMLLGAIAMASLTIGLFFLRFWRNTRDRFFLFFSISFFLEGLNRIFIALDQDSSERAPLVYSVRLLSFLLILIAIIDKNRPPKAQ